MVKNFRFPVRVDKSQSYTTTKSDGSTEAYLVAVASSDTLDSYWEYFAVSALQDMVGYARARKELKPDQGLVELRETHWSTAAIGTVVDGYIRTNNETKAVEFWIVIKLKMDYPFARELFDDVMNNIADKQLSVGGWIDWASSEEAFEVEWQKFISEESDQDEIEVLVGRINRFILEHVAVTLPGFAANDDTRFIEGMLKSFKDIDFQEKMNKHRALSETNNLLGENRISIVERVSQMISETTEELKSLQRSQEEAQMSKPIEAAKAFLKSLVGKSEEEVSEVLEKSGLAELLSGSSRDETESETEDTSGVEEGSDETEDTSKGEEDTEEVDKSAEEEDELAKTDDSEEEDAALKAIEELAEQVADLKSQVSNISEEDSSEELKNFISTTIETFEKLNSRLCSIEKSIMVAKGATYEQGEDPARDKSLTTGKEDSPKGFWVK